ncbi:GGDEF domain-containing response regulator [Acetivibrio clariflavus]|uniref:Stage 0 sporulation protein A homolog n=1 Tax=Acetivibrio clariflavus (strain DSM 19732 / NBRC 101661 / EBR45) TaxID=720554 RepID=G8LTV9_ACECE|nr:diguanylate cyclase [Acetivibrio clariflavus]AEV67305.1 diguanylate cyclase (GGDEF) domain-containing protein [Acetivibrio clariflavus DSM 19732]HOQ00610.1 diguanylate cyclase [Acetivibrio clariflavus]HPU42246.1 diguanylate cyclase [Acetivibrio clariflavus]
MKSIKSEKILLLGPDKTTKDLSQKLSNVGFDVLVANNTDTALKFTEVTTPSVIILDIAMQSNDGKDLLTILKSKVNLINTPLIALSENTDEDSLVYTFLHGANDFIGLPFKFKELLARINNQIKIRNIIKDLEEKNRELTKRNEILEQLAITDSLTEIYNKGYILKRLKSELLRSARYNEPLSLIMIDIDHFKRINDSLGHIAGDNTLRELSKVLVKSVRDVDIVARYGGEEFIVLCPNTSVSGAAILAERIRENVQNTAFQFGNIDIRLTVSLGLSSISPSYPAIADVDTSKLIEEADSALYKAKSSGRNKVAVHTDELGPVCIEDSQEYKHIFIDQANENDKFTRQ